MIDGPGSSVTGLTVRPAVRPDSPRVSPEVPLLSTVSLFPVRSLVGSEPVEPLLPRIVAIAR